MTEEPKKLYRSKGNRILGGVLGGLGEYLGIDPTALRAIYILFALLTGVMPLILAYVILLLVIPNKK